ncbi:RseA family anti-sigma factor [Vibrio sp. S4M6]|uniref:RseA family anti-sigma factor n=1 Tax=Vibrio sinus TaxID=2946865 RepID=UPI00202A9F8C|nr:RseA family anti-sigma factor [Vibrio sinus]MCL9781527.1 RseA family anti-sigma factor [Vibrio sinus]
MAGKEKLSALMDGEMIDKSLISELVDDHQGLQTWKNYHLIGDVMRGEAPENPNWNIAESVALALENEPAHNPMSTNTVLNLGDAKLEAQPEPSAARRRLPKWLSPVSQVAVAASVTLAVVLGFTHTGSDNAEQNSASGAVQVLNTLPWGGSASPVSLTRSSVENNSAHTRRVILGYSSDFDKQMLMKSQSN